METVEQLVSFAHIQVHLSGGAPWGFTLKGGLEHGEPLIITKIEDGGKAALCEKLRVGDELININGTVLYGSRQEALILIKGSYRVLKLTVRRRSVPVLRPHSWHLDQVPEPALPPPPPPSPPCLAPADSAPLPPPPPSAMQLHPGPYSLPWHNNDHSDLSMQWGQLTRPYSSTDRSSSLGSMESLDTPTPTAQTNYDSHNSPVDPALFNNKRDSAYSSFSASSNTSDYATVPLRFGEGSSMENLLQNLGPNVDATSQGLDNGQLIALKSRSLTRPRPKPIEIKERPSSCCYEDERKVDLILRNGNEESARKSNPPQPPTRKDSFRATKSRPNVTSKRCASAPIEIADASSFFEDSVRKCVQNGFPVSEDDKGDSSEPYYVPNKAPLTCSKSDAETSIYRPQNKHTTNVLHRHSAPEKLLATQLQLLEFDTDNTPVEPFIPAKSTNLSSSSGSQWSQSEKDQDSLHNHFQTSSNKWGGSRCSTPGSVFLEDGGEECNFSSERSAVNGGTASPSQVSWGRSISVPDEPLALSFHKRNSDQLIERDFEPLSSASSVDTLVEKKIDIEGESATLKKTSRNLRKNRRRNERFATNLRNEIQRKKAQLQSSRAGPGGLLCSGETVHEEGPDFYEDGEPEVPERKDEVAFTTTTTTCITTTQETTTENSSMDSSCDVLPVQPNTNRSVQIVDPGVPSFGVGIRVVEEPAPAGKARRWRWTPENKLQPENVPQTKRNVEKLFGVASSRHGVCAFTSSSTSSHPRSMSCSRMDESDLLPFADRMKFFEETSKTGVTKAPPIPAKQRPYLSESQAGDIGYQSQRRYSYQGGYRQESSSLMEARRQSVSAKEREDRLRQREIERQTRELEFEKARQREKEKEERMRQWERDREIERQEELERLREMDRLKREKEEMEREKQGYFTPRSQDIHQSYHQHREDYSSFQPSVHDFEQSQVSRSAFYPVNGPSQHFDNQQHQGFQARSHTPTEMYPARPQETAKLNRKYSLTERDYGSRRWESRPADPPQSHQSRWTHRHHDHAHSNGYSSAPPPAPLRARAMSENDLRFDTNHRWSPSLSVASSQTLSEVEEGLSDNVTEKPTRKKMPPPPRPPPPKWEQFHKRRASHHAVYSSSVPPTFTGDYSIQSSYEPEMSRQRSYSLPPQRQDLSTTAAPCPKCSCHQSPPQDPPPTNHTQPHDHRQPPPYQAQEAPRYPHVSASDVQSSTQVHPSHISFDQSQIQASRVSLSNKVQPTHVPAFQIEQSHISSSEIQPLTNPIPQIHPSHIQTSHQAHPSSHKQPPHIPPSNQLHDLKTNDIAPSQVPPPPPHLSSNQGPPQLPVFSIAPPSPMFSRRAFRPVVPPLRNSRGSVGEEAEEFPPPPPPVADDIEDSLSDSEISHIQDQDQVQVIKTQSITRHTVEWERTPSPTMHSETVSPPPPPPSPPAPVVPNGNTEPFHSIDFQQHHLKSEFVTLDNINDHKSIEIEESETTLSPSPSQSLEADLDAPLETDIDDFQEEELPVANEHINSELPCLALPVTVLETDLDLLPDQESSPSGKARPESSLLGEEELEVQEGSLEEIFPQSSEGESGTESWRGASQSTEHNTDSLDRRSGASSSCSSYYSTSTAKAQLLTQMKDFTENRDRLDHDELTYKRQLMESLRKKLGVLREAQRGLQEDIRANAQLGEEVEAMVVSVCKPNEVDKFRMFIGDLDKVVSLMLSLSGRLLRVETTLDTLDSEADHEERLPLQEKKRQLMRQLSEAQDLKEHVDRREQAVSRVLGRCLTPEQHRDYSHFVKMKAALLVEQRQLEDKIRLGEEQLRGLRESLGLGLGVGMGLAMGYGQY